ADLEGDLGGAGGDLELEVLLAVAGALEVGELDLVRVARVALGHGRHDGHAVEGLVAAHHDVPGARARRLDGHGLVVAPAVGAVVPVAHGRLGAVADVEVGVAGATAHLDLELAGALGHLDGVEELVGAGAGQRAHGDAALELLVIAAAAAVADGDAGRGAVGGAV